MSETREAELNSSLLLSSQSATSIGHQRPQIVAEISCGAEAAGHVEKLRDVQILSNRLFDKPR
jgi:hypothetical protein